MQQKKQIPPEEKERIDSLDIPYEDTGSPESALENEEEDALTGDEEAEQDDLISDGDAEEDFVWEPGRQPNQRED